MELKHVAIVILKDGRIGVDQLHRSRIGGVRPTKCCEVETDVSVGRVFVLLAAQAVVSASRVHLPHLDGGRNCVSSSLL
jgi:hypothetical protein